MADVLERMSTFMQSIVSNTKPPLHDPCLLSGETATVLSNRFKPLYVPATLDCTTAQFEHVHPIENI